MKKHSLNDMSKGWFVGNFLPSVISTQEVEIAVKEYPANFSEDWHYHKIATEITVIVSGEVQMNGQRFEKGDIIVIEPGEGTDFMALTETVTTVVKIPGASNDKYLK
jgi:hypothetical protein